MKKLWLVLLATLVVLPFAAVPANAQVGVGVGVGPAVVDPGYYADYGPPDCEWGYYSYYPYACAPYGYYGPNWFYGGVFIGVGPWYHWGFYGWGYYLRGGSGSRRIRRAWRYATADAAAMLGAAMPAADVATPAAVAAVTPVVALRVVIWRRARGGFSGGGGFHGGGGGGFHGGGGGGHGGGGHR
jgi:hypothetical protein